MTDEYTCYISYYSEVSAELEFWTWHDRVNLRVTHPQQTDDNRVTFHDWYWFTDHEAEEIRRKFPSKLAYEVDIGDAEREAVLQCLHWAAEDMWPGPKFYFERTDRTKDWSDDKQYENFRQDLLYALLWGEHAPVKSGSQAMPEGLWIDEWWAEHWDG